MNRPTGKKVESEKLRVESEKLRVESEGRDVASNVWNACNGETENSREIVTGIRLRADESNLDQNLKLSVNL